MATLRDFKAAVKRRGFIGGFDVEVFKASGKCADGSPRVGIEVRPRHPDKWGKFTFVHVLGWTDMGLSWPELAGRAFTPPPRPETGQVLGYLDRVERRLLADIAAN